MLLSISKSIPHEKALNPSLPTGRLPKEWNWSRYTSCYWSPNQNPWYRTASGGCWAGRVHPLHSSPRGRPTRLLCAVRWRGGRECGIPPVILRCPSSRESMKTTTSRVSVAAHVIFFIAKQRITVLFFSLFLCCRICGSTLLWPLTFRQKQKYMIKYWKL